MCVCVWRGGGKRVSSPERRTGCSLHKLGEMVHAFWLGPRAVRPDGIAYGAHKGEKEGLGGEEAQFILSTVGQARDLYDVSSS